MADDTPTLNEVFSGAYFSEFEYLIQDFTRSISNSSNDTQALRMLEILTTGLINDLLDTVVSMLDASFDDDQELLKRVVGLKTSFKLKIERCKKDMLANPVIQ